jgi:hypothetical protein
MAVVTTSSIEDINYANPASVKTSSVDAAYSDPDLLIREYFLSSSEQRAKSRSTIASHVQGLKSVFAILSWGASGKVQDSFDGAVNLLAETNDLEILNSACQTVKKPYLQMYRNPSTRVFSENFLEILIKAIACAYKVNANQRLRLLTQSVPSVDNRIIKASLIDALVLVSDEVDANTVQTAIERYTSDFDQYIRDYASEALQDIG